MILLKITSSQTAFVISHFATQAVIISKHETPCRKIQYLFANRNVILASPNMCITFHDHFLYKQQTFKVHFLKISFCNVLSQSFLIYDFHDIQPFPFLAILSKYFLSSALQPHIEPLSSSFPALLSNLIHFFKFPCSAFLAGPQLSTLRHRRRLQLT